MRSDTPRPTVAELQAEGVLLVEDGNHGEYRPRSDEFVSHGVAFIRAADMDGGRVLFEQAERINDVARARIRKGIGRAGDVLLSHKGTVGKVSLAPEDAPPYVCSPQTTFWRTLDTSRLDRHYLYAYLRSPDFRAQLASRKGETDMADYVSLTAQRQLRVPLPEIAVQRSIGETVSALDNRIDLLRQTNATLESIAQALFKSWFIDFEPVRAKAEGREPEGMEPAATAPFPREFEESALGLIPKGWEASTLGTLCELTKGCSYKGEGLSEEAGAYMFNLGCFNAQRVFAREKVKRYTGEYRPRHAVSPGDLIIANTDMTQARDILGRPALVPHGFEPGFVSHHVFKVTVRAQGPHDPTALRNYLLFTFREPRFRERAIGYATGTTVLALPASAVTDCPACIPDAASLHAWNAIVQPLFDAIRSNEARAEQLVSLRNTLLPRLISRKLRMPEIESQVVEALA